MAELNKRDLKTSDAAKLLQEYRFNREASLRSIQQSRINFALTCFIISFAALQIALSNPDYQAFAYTASLVIAIGGAAFALMSFSPVKEAEHLNQKNEEFIEEMENYFENR